MKGLERMSVQPGRGGRLFTKVGSYYGLYFRHCRDWHCIRRHRGYRGRCPRRSRDA